MPIDLYPAITAPLNPVAPTSAAITSPSTANASTNGMIARWTGPRPASRSGRTDDPVNAVAGRVLVTAARLALTAAVSAAELNRYSICNPVCGLPLCGVAADAFGCRMSDWVGQTQALAVPVTENAKTHQGQVDDTVPRRSASPCRRRARSGPTGHEPGRPRRYRSATVHCRRSTGRPFPSGPGGPTTVIAPTRSAPSEDMVALTVSNGPADVCTPAVCAVAASVALSVTTGSNWPSRARRTVPRTRGRTARRRPPANPDPIPR